MENNQGEFRPRLPLPQMWPKRQKIQQVLAKPTLMKRVERINAVVVRNPLQGQGSRGGGIRRDSYAMEMNRERNGYSCREFGHLVWNCRNQGTVGQGKELSMGTIGMI